MLETFGNIWNYLDEYDAVVVTTNGFVKKNGEAVMGRGIALEAKQRYPWLPKRLGELLTKGANVPYAFEQGSCCRLILTMPVKPRFGPTGQPGWAVKADIGIIKNSALELSRIADELELTTIIMPRPGCGNGGLSWNIVRPVIEPILDNRFTVITFYPD